VEEENRYGARARNRITDPASRTQRRGAPNLFLPSKIQKSRKIVHTERTHPNTADH